MANLLPLQEKLHLKKTYRLRLIAVALIFSFLLIEAGVLMLLPAFFLSFVREKEAREQLVVLKQVVSVEEQKNVRDEIEKTNSRIELLLGEEHETGLVSKAIEQVIGERGDAIRLNSFFSSKRADDATKNTFVVSGIAKNREVLLSFVNKLREDPLLSDVRLPVSNFVKNIDVPFSISLTINNHAGGI